MRLAWDDYALFAFFIGFIPCVSLFILLLAFAQARRTDVGIVRRRWISHAFTIWSTPAALLLHLPFMKYYVTSVYLRISSNALFDNPVDFVKLFIGLVLGSWLLVLSVGLLTERRLFGPPEGDPVSIEITPFELAVNKRVLAWSLTLAMLAAWGAVELLGGLFPGRTALFMAFFSFVAVWIISGVRMEAVVKAGRHAKTSEPAPPELAERIRNLAEKAGVEISGVEIAGPGLVPSGHPAQVSRGILRLHSKYIEMLSPEEMEFMAVHAAVIDPMLRTPLNNLIQLAAVLACVPVPAMLFGGLYVRRQSSFLFQLRYEVWTYVVFGVCFALLMGLTVALSERTRRLNRQAIRTALKATQNLPAAESALDILEEHWKRSHNECAFSVKEWRDAVRKAGE